MKPPRWRRHLNIFPSASRNTDIQEASCPHPLPLPYICHLPTYRSVPSYIRVVEERSSSYRTELRPFRSPLPFSLSLASPDFGEVVRGRNFNVTSIQCPLGYDSFQRLATSSSHHSPIIGRLYAMRRENSRNNFQKVGKNIVYEIYKKEIDSFIYFLIDSHYVFYVHNKARLSCAGKNIKISETGFKVKGMFSSTIIIDTMGIDESD